MALSRSEVLFDIFEILRIILDEIIHVFFALEKLNMPTMLCLKISFSFLESFDLILDISESFLLILNLHRQFS